MSCIDIYFHSIAPVNPLYRKCYLFVTTSAAVAGEKENFLPFHLPVSLNLV